MKSRNVRCAFTLIEMLVVIVIIGILVGLLMPALMKALDKARSAKCAANMSSIYRAYVMRTADEQANFRWIPIRSSGWAGILLAYVDGKEKVFRCPVDRTGHWGGIDAMVHGEARGGGQGGKTGLMPLETGQNFGWTYASYHGGGNAIYFPGCSEWFLSVCWCIGTQGSTSWQVSIAGPNTAQTAETVIPGGASVVFTVRKATKRLEVTYVDSSWCQALPLYDGKGAFNKQIGSTNLTALPGASISVGMVDYCSYGMNDYDIKGPGWTGLGGGGWMQETYFFMWPKIPANKVLFMDYTNAQISASRMMTNSVSWGTNVVSFRRHTSLTKSNVMFGDGSVQMMDPSSIDPGVGGNYERYWQPEQQ